MSDTPRTDSLLTAILDLDGYVAHRNCPPTWVSHSRELERELNAANTEIEEKRKDVVWLATEKAKLENYVMLLEEALQKTINWISEARESGDVGYLTTSNIPEVIAAKAALKAKEDKP